jgi:hypothetical protein
MYISFRDYSKFYQTLLSKHFDSLYTSLKCFTNQYIFWTILSDYKRVLLDLSYMNELDNYWIVCVLLHSMSFNFDFHQSILEKDYNDLFKVTMLYYEKSNSKFNEMGKSLTNNIIKQSHDAILQIQLSNLKILSCESILRHNSFIKTVYDEKDCNQNHDFETHSPLFKIFKLQHASSILVNFGFLELIINYNTNYVHLIWRPFKILSNYVTNHILVDSCFKYISWIFFSDYRRVLLDLGDMHESDYYWIVCVLLHSMSFTFDLHQTIPEKAYNDLFKVTMLYCKKSNSKFNELDKSLISESLINNIIKQFVYDEKNCDQNHDFEIVNHVS